MESPAEFLRTQFLERKRKNPVYSTRAFARDLGMSQALLSLVLNGKRPLTTKQAARIAILLSLDSCASRQLVESTLFAAGPRGKVRLQKTVFKEHSLERFKAISQWHHLAILDLATTVDFQPEPACIARRLGISTLEAQDAVARLLALGFLVLTQGTLCKADSQIYFVTRETAAAVRCFHRAMLAKAQAMLDRTEPADFRRREISAITLAVKSERIPEAKKRIEKFQKEMAAFLTEGECDEVFQLNVQLFPLTQREK